MTHLKIHSEIVWCFVAEENYNQLKWQHAHNTACFLQRGTRSAKNRPIVVNSILGFFNVTTFSEELQFHCSVDRVVNKSHNRLSHLCFTHGKIVKLCKDDCDVIQV